MSDHITLPRELVFRAVKVLSPMAYDNWPRERNEVVAALRDRLAATSPEQTPRITRITCGFSDVQFDGERWRCGKCGERMNEHFEEMVKHYNGKDYLELMQRKADHKAGRVRR